MNMAAVPRPCAFPHLQVKFARRREESFAFMRSKITFATVCVPVSLTAPRVVIERMRAYRRHFRLGSDFRGAFLLRRAALSIIALRHHRRCNQLKPIRLYS